MNFNYEVKFAGKTLKRTIKLTEQDFDECFCEHLDHVENNILDFAYSDLLEFLSPKLTKESKADLKNMHKEIMSQISEFEEEDGGVQVTIKNKAKKK